MNIIYKKLSIFVVMLVVIANLNADESDANTTKDKLAERLKYEKKIREIGRKMLFVTQQATSSNQEVKMAENELNAAKKNLADLKKKVKNSITRYYYYANDKNKDNPKLYKEKPPENTEKGDVKFIDKPDPALEKMYQEMLNVYKKTAKKLDLIRAKNDFLKESQSKMETQIEDYKSEIENLKE
jgi:hypothetical protein